MGRKRHLLRLLDEGGIIQGTDSERALRGACSFSVGAKREIEKWGVAKIRLRTNLKMNREKGNSSRKNEGRSREKVGRRNVNCEAGQ